MSESVCQHVTLARNPLAKVQHCTDCGTVSLSIGPTTVRMDALALEALWVVLGEAAGNLQAEAQRETPHLRIVP